jgi:hypothetical protein
MTGLGFIIQPFVQMIGGFLHPGKPMANMYFVLFSYSESQVSHGQWPSVLNHRKIDSVNQAALLLRDLKIAQCRFASPYHFWISEFSFLRPPDTKLPPRAAFTAQIMGTLLGSVLNYSGYSFSFGDRGVNMTQF